MDDKSIIMEILKNAGPNSALLLGSLYIIYRMLNKNLDECSKNNETNRKMMEGFTTEMKGLTTELKILNNDNNKFQLNVLQKLVDR